MSLLPKNSTLQDQDFAKIIDSQSVLDFSDISFDPMVCDASLLPHIAFMIGANIDNMEEDEARLYLKTYNRKLLGTVGAVEDAARVYFDNAQIIEWFEDKELEKGYFSLFIDVKDDTRFYNLKTVHKAVREMRKNKNVRSQLSHIHMSYVQEQDFSLSSGCVAEADVDVSMVGGYKETLTNDFLPHHGCVCESFCEIKMER
jgi:P2-related tail formation protein